MDEQTTRSKSLKLTNNFPEATEAGAEPPSGSRILGQDDRWMSRQRALNPQTNHNSPEAISPQKTKSPSDPKFQPEATEAGAEPLQALESSVRMTDG